MLKSFAIAGAAALLGPAIGVVVFFASTNDQSEATSASRGTERFTASGETEVIVRICLKGWSACLNLSPSKQSCSEEANDRRADSWPLARLIDGQRTGVRPFMIWRRVPGFERVQAA
jgi:hypothetical protein